MGGASCVGWIRVDLGGAGVEFLSVIRYNVYLHHTHSHRDPERVLLS